MALVAYSDSEGSDNEETSPSITRPAASKPTPAFQKSTSEPRKIKVALPTLKPEVEDERPVKKARTAGAFGGFNSLLPAPKRAAVAGGGGSSSGSAGGPGGGRAVGLKTSGQAAFSREAPPAFDGGFGDSQDGGEDGEGWSGGVDVGSAVDGGITVKDANDTMEVKTVGKATRFRPLSVANKKKKPITSKSKVAAKSDGPVANGKLEAQPTAARATALPVEPTQKTKPKPKPSLFSVPQDEDPTPLATSNTSTVYEPLIASETTQPQHLEPLPEDPLQPPTRQNQHQQQTTLQSTAADLNLTPSQLRHLFGRHAKDPSAAGAALFNSNITHFDTSAEYAANEVLRQSGEQQQQSHRAVKTVAPGKHSLQQLVNTAANSKEALEDHWAEGKRNRGEGQGKYGWGK